MGRGWGLQRILRLVSPCSLDGSWEGPEVLQLVGLTRPTPWVSLGHRIQCGNQGSTIPSCQDNPQHRLEMLTLLATSVAGQGGADLFTQLCLSDRDEAWAPPPASH